jgi:hypothetical protein
VPSSSWVKQAKTQHYSPEDLNAKRKGRACSSVTHPVAYSLYRLSSFGSLVIMLLNIMGETDVDVRTAQNDLRRHAPNEKNPRFFMDS